jgi:predicted nucleic acid-binding protein
MRYMLDPDTSSYIMKRSNENVLRRLQMVAVSDVCVSVITKSELLFGVECLLGDSRTKRPWAHSSVTWRFWISLMKRHFTMPGSGRI